MQVHSSHEGHIAIGSLNRNNLNKWRKLYRTMKPLLTTAPWTSKFCGSEEVSLYMKALKTTTFLSENYRYLKYLKVKISFKWSPPWKVTIKRMKEVLLNYETFIHPHFFKLDSLWNGIAFFVTKTSKSDPLL